MAILDLQRRLHETGRIRIGASRPAKSAKGKDVRVPVKLDSFLFTSANQRALDAVARLFGGAVEPWQDAPAKGQLRVLTTAAELPVLVPPEEFALSQWYELWSGGGCVRRCDGVTQPETGELCLCDMDSRECRPTTRLSLMLPQLPGSGLWRLETHGYYAAVELQGAFEMARRVAEAAGRSIVPATLRLTHREVRRPGEPTKEFSVPVLDFDVQALLGPVPALGAGAAVTPLPADPPRSLRAELEAVDEDRQRAQRANGAEPIRRTGLRPRTAAERRQETTVTAQQGEDGDAIPSTAPSDDRPSPITVAQVAAVARAFDAVGITSKADCHRYIEDVIAHPYRRLQELTSEEALVVLSTLTAKAPADPSDPMTDRQRARLFALLAEHDITDDAERHSYATVTLGRETATYSELTVADAQVLIDDLSEHLP